MVCYGLHKNTDQFRSSDNIGGKLKQTDGLNYEGSEQDQNRGSLRMLEKTMKFFC